MPIVSRWSNDNIKVFARKVEQLQKLDKKILPRIVNQVGDLTKTQVIAKLTDQTGLKKRVISKAIGKPFRAHQGRLTYVMNTHGGDIRLKYFEAAETRKGVTASPFGKRQLFTAHFMRAGWWPNRVEKDEWKGQVKRRAGKGVVTARSGLFIPVEMTKGATRKVFLVEGGPVLQRRVEAALKKLIP